MWSADVLTELRRNLIEREIPPDHVDRRIAHMTRSFPDALVVGYESLIDGMTNHPKDRHVLAASVRANAEVIVTFNLSDFPEPALKPYDVAAIHPDEFLLDQLDLYPGVTVEVLRQQAASYRRVRTPCRIPSSCSNAPAYRGSPQRYDAISSRRPGNRPPRRTDRMGALVLEYAPGPDRARPIPGRPLTTSSCDGVGGGGGAGPARSGMP